MFPTMEVRWFYKGAVSPEVWQWFRQGERKPEEQSSRVDYYLCLSNGSSLGIKLREGRIEIKQRHRRHGVVRLHQRVTGAMEHWRKWSFELSETDSHLASIAVPASSWIGVKKTRRLCRYQLTHDKWIVAVPAEACRDQGCDLELTSIAARGKEWWSLSFEAFGDEALIEQYLLLMADWIFAAGEPPAFDVQDSYGYPRWLEIVEGREGECRPLPWR